MNQDAETDPKNQALAEGFRAELARLKAETNQAFVEGLRAELARLQAELDEQTKLAADRAEEVRGRGDDIEAFGRGVEDLVNLLWPSSDALDLLGNLDVVGNIPVLFARMRTRIEYHFGRGAGADLPVDHARETLAQLEVLLQGRTAEQQSDAERWGAVAGRVCALIELNRGHEHAQDERDTRDVLEHGAVPVKPLEVLLERWLEQALVSFLGKERREVLTVCAGELAQVVVEHAPTPAAGLLGGMGTLLPLTTREGG